MSQTVNMLVSKNKASSFDKVIARPHQFPPMYMSPLYDAHNDEPLKALAYNTDWGVPFDHTSSEAWLRSLIPDPAKTPQGNVRLPPFVAVPFSPHADDFQAFGSSESVQSDGTWGPVSLGSIKSFVPSVVVTKTCPQESDLVSALYDDPDVDDLDVYPPATIWVLNNIFEDLGASDGGGATDDEDDELLSLGCGSGDETYSFVGSDYTPATVGSKGVAPPL